MNGSNGDEHATRPTLQAYLTQALPADDKARLRCHLDHCAACWSTWNRHRWDAARPSHLYRQLAEYLGPEFRPYLDSSRALAAEWDNANPQTPQAAADFFRTSTSYLYNLVIWEASGNRPDYHTRALPHLTRHESRKVLDYGCGIGSDALSLHTHGFTVLGCDYHSPSTRFLGWRGHHTIPVVEPETLTQADDIDTLWIIDTLDHLPDIDTALGPLLSTVRLVITENLTENRAHGRQRFHHRRPIAHTLRTLASYGITPQRPESGDTIMVWSRTPC